MFNAIKQLFRPLSSQEMKARELKEAECSLLEAQSAREYAAAMVTYHEARIARLRGVVGPERFGPQPQPLTPQEVAARAARLNSVNLPSSVPHGY
jgi:hypothetical protein